MLSQMLRRVARPALRSATPAPLRALSTVTETSAPTVADITVHITFIDHEGSRAIVPGRIGMTISDVAELHGIDIGPTCGGGVVDKVHSEVWTEDLFGEGVNLGYDHVKIPQVWLEKVRPRGDWELELLKNYWDEHDIEDSSRLGSHVVLEKALDGIQVFIPDGIPVEGSL